MKFKAKAKEYQLLVKAKTSFGEVIDEKELDRFARVFIRGFLKPKLLKKNLVEYVGPVGVSLNDRFKKPITKRDFLFIIEQVVVAVQKLQANKMPLNNLVMDINYAFINEVTKEVQFIYMPLSAGQKEYNLISFIEAIVYSLKPADEKDDEFASRFIHFFKAMKPFDISTIEKYVAKEDRSIVNTIKKQNAGQSGFMTDKPQHYHEHYDEKDGDEDEPTGILVEEDDDPTGLLVDTDATGLLDDSEDDATGLLSDPEDEATGRLSDDDEEATGLLNPDDDDEATGLLSQNNANVRFPTLFRVLTEETISVNKPVFRLGKERSYVDYFVTNNIAVSRSHADIITRGTRYFVIDLNSKNHTYINDQELPIHVETEIQDGDRLRLGNEEFVFNT